MRTAGGRTVEWDAVIHNELANELIAWRSLPGSDVDSAGSVWFKPRPNGRGAEGRVEMQFNPPAGAVGAAVVSLLGANPEKQMAEDLENLKHEMESTTPAEVA